MIPLRMGIFFFFSQLIYIYLLGVSNFDFYGYVLSFRMHILYHWKIHRVDAYDMYS